MNLVLDVSSAVELVLGRPRAGAVSEALAGADLVCVPDLFAAEATNVFWKLQAFAGVERARCERALEYALALPDRMVAGTDLAADAFALAADRRRPAYDLFYLVLARRRGALLVTEDAALAALARELGVHVG